MIISIVLEASITTLPLSLVSLLLVYVYIRESWIYAAAFLSGFVLDILHISPIGFSSICFVGFLLLVHIYERKFEIQTKEFVLLASFLGSTMFLLLRGDNYALVQALTSSLLAVILFQLINFILSHRRRISDDKKTI